MPWGSNFIAVSGGSGGALSVTFTSDQTDLDLWVYFGSPSSAAVANVIVDGCDIRTFSLGAWPAGSVINLTVINSGRIVGRGGVGGAGGGATPYGANENEGHDGVVGGDGGDALAATGAITVNINLDAGYCWGGGGAGGGGGGSSGSNGGGNYGGGGGGGGGQGWNNPAGGTGGVATKRTGSPGSAGNDVGGPGIGGFSGHHTGVAHAIPDGDGGDGGAWGTAGNVGVNCWQYNVAVPLLDQVGGAGGAAGKAINAPSTVFNFVGASNEATLIGAGRIVGASTHI